MEMQQTVKYHLRVISQRIQERAEFTFNESTKLQGYFVQPVLSIHKLISACLDRCGDTPEPYDPKIIRTRLYLLILFLTNSLHQAGVIGLVVCQFTDVVIINPEFSFHIFKYYSSRFIVQIYISYIAPEEALLTVEFNGELFFLEIKIAFAPQNNDDLIIAPIFCGSVILSQRIQIPSGQVQGESAYQMGKLEHLTIIF